jgi:hypothetical protein
MIDYSGATESSPTMDTFHTSSSCYSLPLQCTAGLHPQNPRHTAWQPSARVSQTSCPSSHLSHVIVATTWVDEYWHLHRWLHKYTDLRALHFAHYPDLWYRPRLADVACAWSWRVYELNPTILTYNPLQTSNHSDHMGVAITRYKWRGLTDVGGAECEALAMNMCRIWDFCPWPQLSLRQLYYTHPGQHSIYKRHCTGLSFPCNMRQRNPPLMEGHRTKSPFCDKGGGGEWLDCRHHSVQKRSRPTHCPIQCLPRILSPEQSDRD